MKKIFIAGIAAAALFGAPAIAADMPVKAPVYKAPAPVFSWTGCYVGANAGGGWSDKSWRDPPAAPNDDLGSEKGSGFAGGGQIGCDYQSSNWVFGVRGMFDWTSLTSSHEEVPFAGFFDHSKVKGFETATARIGYALQPTLLVYGQGGFAFAQDHFWRTDTGIAAGGIDADAHSHTRVGWDAGIGVEWIFAPRWSVWLEYDYMGFRKKTTTFDLVPGPGSFQYEIGQNVQAVLVGVNYRFDMGKAPVVAKY